MSAQRAFASRPHSAQRRSQPRPWRWVVPSRSVCRCSIALAIGCDRRRLVGSAASVACPVWYASEVASPSTLQVIVYAFLTGFVVNFSPFVSFATWGLATAERKSCKRAAQGIVFGVILGATSVTVACVTSCYVTLSDRVSGFAGVAINGKGRWRDN